MKCLLMKTNKEESFYERVYKVVRIIPFGRVTSYGAIANSIGSPQAARMVGWAMNNSHGIIPYVPAHRVVNRKGLLTGKSHFGGQSIMGDLLRSEGIIIENDQIVDFQKVFWEPEIECQ